jgi:zinc protease
MVQEKFRFTKPAGKGPVEYAPEPEQTQVRRVENASNINTGFVIFGFHGPKACNLKDSIAVDIISIILGENKSSRLYQNLIEKPETPVFNVIGTGQYQFKDGNTFFIQANFHPSQKEKAIELIRDQLRDIIDFPVKQEELEKARKTLKARFARESETVSEIGESIGHYMTVCNDISGYTNYLHVLDTLTIEDIFEAARKYLDLNKVSISVLMPEEGEK